MKPFTPAGRAHALVTGGYLASELLLHAAGLPFSFSVDWMWLADPWDLRDRLGETLWYLHAFPPGMNALTGLLLRAFDSAAGTAAHALFLALGVLLVNVLCGLGRAAGFPPRCAAAFAGLFVLIPPSIYFAHLFHYEWVVVTLLAAGALLFYRGVRDASIGAWTACFSLLALVGVFRSTFHLVWFAAMCVMAIWLVPRAGRGRVLRAAILPALCLVALYAKNFVLFETFAASTFGPASNTLITVDHLSDDERDAWIREGWLSPFAAVSVYAPPRAYASFFAGADNPRWPPQLTRLEHRAVRAANYNHWWLLEVHEERSRDVWTYLRRRPVGYLRNVAVGLRDMFAPTTAWHPRDGGDAAPHRQHRAVLGGYERAFNRTLHTWPIAPAGIYLFLPLVLGGAVAVAWPLVRNVTDVEGRARGALLLFCAFQVVYVTAASSMLTFLESPRYRFQIEWAIWLLTLAGVAALRATVARRSHSSRPDHAQHSEGAPAVRS
jgi:hypothetical protein